MLPSKFVSSQQAINRKSRLEANQRPSMLPKPRRPMSNDRLSNEIRRPSAGGQRSSSADAGRGTFGGRLSKEASATKVPLYGRSRLQQSERVGQLSMTPLGSRTPIQSKHYSRSTTTPRTPSQDRASRSWQGSLERALAFVTLKDQRQISSVAWQRTECARVSEALASRGGEGGATLVRPLTIARFVDITGALLDSIIPGTKLTTDNYVTKLPHVCKRLLYPGTVSKSWLKTVNTLHAFPHALALIAYLLDLVNHLEMPVSDEQLYVDKDELSCLRRDYLNKCWIRFQEPDCQFDDLTEEYLQNLKLLLGNDDEKIVQLKQTIHEYEKCLNDEEELAAKAKETRLIERRDVLFAALKAVRASRQSDHTKLEIMNKLQLDHTVTMKQLDIEIESNTAESEQLDRELETQPMSVDQRNKLLADIDYSVKVYDSKRALAEQIAKMVSDKEIELAQWQKKTLDSCLKYKQGLIHLTAQFPDLANLAIDENELMSSECASQVSRALEVLRARAAELALKRDEHVRERGALARRRATLLEESRAKVVELRSLMKSEQEALDAEMSRESVEAAAAAAELRVISTKLEQLKIRQDEYNKVDNELRFWEEQDQRWRAKLETMQEYITAKRAESQQKLMAAAEKRAKSLCVCIDGWKSTLSQ